jgi:hypothetical protein
MSTVRVRLGTLQTKSLQVLDLQGFSISALSNFDGTFLGSADFSGA